VTGTIVNTGAILVGSAVGLFAGRHISPGIKSILMEALGLAVILIGIKMALVGNTPVATISCLLLGSVTGELLRIERGVELLGERLKRRFRSESSTFVQGFVAASVLYLTGAMMIVGCIQDGTVGDSSTLFVKSLLDGVAATALASSLGIGVAFSALSVLVVQGGFTLLASALAFLQDPLVLSSVEATGGIIIVGIGVNLLGLKQIKVGNMIPAIVYAMIYPLIL